MRLPVISVEGDSYNLGFQHGKKAKEVIQRNVHFYMDFWKYYGGAKQARILNDAQRFIPHIKRLDPEILEELKGLAEGSELQLEEIVSLNARWELNYAYMPPTSTSSSPGGCTAYALAPGVTQNGHTFVGQNWDYKPSVRESCIILQIKQKEKPDIIMHTEAGIIGHKGFNSAGIGVCLNYIRCKSDFFQPGLPVWIKVRGVLNAKSLPDCMRLLMTFEGPNSVNMVIAHHNGEVIDAECSPTDVFFLYPEDGIVVHTNHFQSPNLRVKDTGKATLPDTVIRSQRAFRLFKEEKNLGRDSIKNILRDHFGYPDSVCRHRDERLSPYEQWETLTSMIIDLTERKMLYTSGPSCSNSYQLIAMDQGNK